MTQNGETRGHVTTEWHDALVKHKIIEKPEKPPSQDEVDTNLRWQIEEMVEKNKYTGLTLEQMDELAEEIDDDDRELERIRAERRAQVLAERLDQQGATVLIPQISRTEWEREITEASREQFVICCLFIGGQEESRVLLMHLETLARKFRRVKFVKIIGQEAIQDYPDKFCPTLVIYKDTNPVGNYKGLGAFGKLNGISADTIEWELAQHGFWKTSLEKDPRAFKLNQLGRAPPTRVQQYEEDDSGSDLDID